MTFEFLWPTTISPRNASLGSLTMMQDGKGLLYSYFLLQIMVKLLSDFWCAERSFPKRTISSNHLGEYEDC